MEAIEHRFTVGLEGRGKEVVQIRLVIEIDPGNGDGAGITLLTGAGCRASLLVGTGGFHVQRHSGLSLRLLFVLPVLEGWVFLHEARDPLVRVLHNVSVHAVLKILLHVCIEEEIQAGNVAE